MKGLHVIQVEGEARLLCGDRVLSNAVQEAVSVIGGAKEALATINHGVSVERQMTMGGLYHMMKVGLVHKAWVAVRLYWASAARKHPVPIPELAGELAWRPDRPDGTNGPEEFAAMDANAPSSLDPRERSSCSQPALARIAA